MIFSSLKSIDIVSRSNALTILSSLQKSKDRFKVQSLNEYLWFSKFKTFVSRSNALNDFCSQLNSIFQKYIKSI